MFSAQKLADSLWEGVWCPLYAMTLFPLVAFKRLLFVSDFYSLIIQLHVLHPYLSSDMRSFSQYFFIQAFNPFLSSLLNI
jgi:hypothetical protein